MRGHKTRKQVEFKKKFGSKISRSINSLIDFLSDEDGLKFVEELIFDDGGVFKGQVKDGKTRHGYGIQIWPDGTKYEGYWRDNLQHG